MSAFKGYFADLKPAADVHRFTSSSHYTELDLIQQNISLRELSIQNVYSYLQFCLRYKLTDSSSDLLNKSCTGSLLLSKVDKHFDLKVVIGLCTECIINKWHANAKGLGEEYENVLA